MLKKFHSVEEELNYLEVIKILKFKDRTSAMQRHLVAYLKNLQFFRDRKMRDREVQEIVYGIEY